MVVRCCCLVQLMVCWFSGEWMENRLVARESSATPPPPAPLKGVECAQCLCKQCYVHCALLFFALSALCSFAKVLVTSDQ